MAIDSDKSFAFRVHWRLLYFFHATIDISGWTKSHQEMINSENKENIHFYKNSLLFSGGMTSFTLRRIDLSYESLAETGSNLNILLFKFFFRVTKCSKTTGW